VLRLDLVNTLSFSALVLFLGYAVRRIAPPLSRVNIPAPVIGGLIVALSITLARNVGIDPIQFDTTLQTPLMIAFFTTIGFGASLSFLKVGGPQVVLFFIVSCFFAIIQNIAGILVALPLGMNPLFGVLCGSVTLTGGPATGLAFAPLFEKAGIEGAASVAIAAAMCGIISGGLIGAPIGTWLIRRRRLKCPLDVPAAAAVLVATDVLELQVPANPPTVPRGEAKGSYALMKTVALILAAMWAGSWVSGWITSAGITLPVYIGAMLVAAAIRNIDDATKLFGLSQRLIDDIGSATLALFIAMALMTLKLWELAGLVLPLLAVISVQVALIALVCMGPIWRIMGRDYDAAVMSGGFCGFMLGTTANAMANMESLVERYGAAPRAYLVVPMVGAFLIDFSNAIIIIAFLNIFK
jgi:glutamate:Na+ symporter, ESS family